MTQRVNKVFGASSLKIQEAILLDPHVIELLKDLSEHHHDTYFHSLRVGLLSIDLGYEEQLEGRKILTLGLAAHLHDVGKKKIELSIIDKKAALDEKEYSKIKTHARQGFIALSEPEMEEVRSVVIQHHEFQPVSYPRTHTDRRDDVREKERRSDHAELNHLGEILAISDTFDALTSRRAYKAPMPIEEVEQILRDQFRGDPSLINKVLRRF